uniref:Alpha beta hydrolase fold-1 domain containing protein n=1 Tax=Haemonchus contortus TaxID=6289 RepID=A0A7I4Y060_HAECO
MGFLYTLFRTVLFRLQQLVWTTATVISLIKDRILYGSECFKPKEHPKPKCLEGWDDQYIQLKSVRLHYVQTGAENKDLLLMLHGFPEFWYSWRYQLKYFADKFRCVAVDQRGYNLSDKPKNVEDYNTDLLVNDIKELVELLGYSKIYLMGHDWGAIIAWKFALYYPDMVEKLVILNVPHPSAIQDLMVTSSEQRLKSWYIFMFQTPTVPELTVQKRDFHMFDVMFRGRKAGIRNAENFTDEDLEAWKHVFSQKGALTGPINYYRNITQSRPLRGEERICKPPTLIIWGDEDQFLVKEGAVASLKYCQHGQVKFIEGASHWVMQDEPSQVNQLVDEFLTTPIHELVEPSTSKL